MQPRQIIRLNTTEFRHCNYSGYDENYYENVMSGDVILERYHESDNTYTYHIVSKESGLVHIGESYAGFEDEMLLPIYLRPGLIPEQVPLSRIVD